MRIADTPSLLDNSRVLALRTATCSAVDRRPEPLGVALQTCC